MFGVIDIAIKALILRESHQNYAFFLLYNSFFGDFILVCNSLLVFGLSQYAHSFLVFERHWMSIEKIIDVKVACLIFYTLHSALFLLIFNLIFIKLVLI
jgi:hypothetical protein